MEKVKMYLLSLGFQPNRLGYKMLAEVINWGVNGEDILPLKFKAYPRLGGIYSKNADTVEKDIANSISVAWLKADLDRLYSEFGETIDMKKGKPTNKQFILTAVEAISR